MKKLMLLISLTASLSNAAPRHYIATEGWYKDMHGTNHISVIVDLEKRKVNCSLSPWFSGATEFKIVGFDRGFLIANSLSFGTKLAINFNEMSMIAGDGGEDATLSFGKSLKAKLSIGTNPKSNK